nr:MAG TPA: hypothetical protein [Caudoviricetes sp.]
MLPRAIPILSANFCCDNPSAVRNSLILVSIIKPPFECILSYRITKINLKLLANYKKVLTNDIAQHIIVIYQQERRNNMSKKKSKKDGKKDVYIIVLITAIVQFLNSLLDLLRKLLE